MGGRAYTRLATALRILLRHYWVVTKLIDNLCINLQMSHTHVLCTRSPLSVRVVA